MPASTAEFTTVQRVFGVRHLVRPHDAGRLLRIITLQTLLVSSLTAVVARWLPWRLYVALYLLFIAFAIYYVSLWWNDMPAAQTQAHGQQQRSQ